MAIVWVLLLALGLRLINLNQSLWLDEAFQFKAISQFSLKEMLTVYLANDFNPPLSYLVNFFFSRLAGFSELALRLPSLVFGVLTVWLTWLLAKNLLPQKLSLLAALLLATSGLHIYYSQEARMYSLVAMAAVGSFWALTGYLKTQKQLVWYLIFLVVLVYSHYLAWFLLPTQLLVVWRLKPKKFPRVLTIQLAALLAFLPWLPIFINQLKTGLAAAGASPTWAQVVGGASLKNFALVPVKFLIGRISLDNDFVYALVLVLPLSLVAWLLFKAWQLGRRQPFAATVVNLWFWLPLVLIALVSLKVPVLSYFRLLFLLPAFYLLLSLGLLGLKARWRRWLVAGLLLVNLVTGFSYLWLPRFHREDWRGLSQTLIKFNPDQQPVVIIATVDAALKYYYAGKIYSYEQFLLQDNVDGFWLVPYSEPIFDPEQDFRQAIEARGLTATRVQHFRGNLTLIKYTR